MLNKSHYKLILLFLISIASNLFSMETTSNSSLFLLPPEKHLFLHPLHNAALKGQIDKLQPLLVNHDVEKTLTKNGQSCLHFVPQRIIQDGIKQTKMIKFAEEIIKHAENEEEFINKKDKFGKTFIHYTVEYHKLSFFKDLIHSKLPVDFYAKDDELNNIAHIAASISYDRIKNVNYEGGVPKKDLKKLFFEIIAKKFPELLDEKNRDNKTPLDLMDIPTLLKINNRDLLRKKGVSYHDIISFRDKDGNTYLHIASQHNQGENVQYLLRNLPNRRDFVSQTNKQGHTARDVTKNNEIVGFIDKYLSKPSLGNSHNDTRSNNYTKKSIKPRSSNNNTPKKETPKYNIPVYYNINYTFINNYNQNYYYNY